MHKIILFGLLLGPFSTSGFLVAKDKTPLSYGAFVQEGGVRFRLFAPAAEQVYVVLFDRPEAETGKEYPMQRESEENWSLTIPGLGLGTLYGFRLEGSAPWFDPGIIVADPYTKAAVTQNSYRHVAKSLIVDTSYDWGDDQWIAIDPRDLIIYELHIRDETIHPSAQARAPGTYRGLVELNQRGGLAHIKEMGYNAVQIMPAMEFANVEVPYRDPTTPVYNTWNPYARNHWGYMTTFFFAPESYYASDGTDEPNAWNGTEGRAVREFKDMMKAFHQEGIAVIMDVVYNHVSNYDYHPFKYIDREQYFRLKENGDYQSQSGTGNDTRTESPVVRQLILESAEYWMREYHIDGFRFDLGNLIDPETRKEIIHRLKSINPHVIILAEPWGGGYDPSGFSEMGWASFNDQFRNGVKGQNPLNGKGFIFGDWQNGNNQASLRRYVMGSLKTLGGQYVQVAHSVNYLESHDDYTLGDFIRIGTGAVAPGEAIQDRRDNACIRGTQLALNKLGALYLFTSQGIVFTHQGQSWGRSKVVASTVAPDSMVGQLDHNSYEKDNETNWLNWEEKAMNRPLVDYYRGLISLRKKYPEFRHADPEDYTFFDVSKKVAVAYLLKDRFIVALNGETKDSLDISLPPGNWKVLVDENEVNLNGHKSLQRQVSIPPTSGIVLLNSPTTGQP
ncbi:MAG: pullulanase [Fidelibacterota bacterium]